MKKPAEAGFYLFFQASKFNVVDKFLAFFRKKKNPQLDRYYAHSLEHQEEEFEAYERPLHEYMEKHCPQATAASKEERAPNGKPYRW